MNPAKVTRLAAIACIVASFPVSVLKYSWLPATVVQFFQLWRGPVPTWATESFRIWHAGQLQHLEVALVLYALGVAALAGLGAVVGKILPVWGELAVWIVTGLTALEVAAFERPGISAYTDSIYIFVMIRLPVGIALVAAIAAITNLAMLLRRRYAGEFNSVLR